jgi:hypothetical protein
MPAMTGMNGSFITKSATFSAKPLSAPMRGNMGLITANTITLTIATITRNVVPQRGCSVVFFRAFATTSSSSAS